MQTQTKAIIITTIGICSLFFLSSVEASNYALTSAKHAKYSDVSHRYNGKRYLKNNAKRHKSSSRHKREKIGALIGGVLIGTALAGSSRDTRSSYSSRSDDYRGHNSRQSYHDNRRDSRYGNRRHNYRDKNYTGYRGYRDTHRHDYHTPHHHGRDNRHHDRGNSRHRNQYTPRGHHSGSKTYAPNYELRRDHNDRLSCYRVKMYRKGEKVFERVDRDFCGW